MSGETEMELGTFGAVMAFASQMVAQSVAYYESASTVTQSPDLQEVLQSLVDEGKKVQATIARTRRENITEMILEPIAGLRPQDYAVDAKKPEPGSTAANLATALLLAERDHRFFVDSSAKLPLLEVARIFRRAAHRKEQEVARLRALMS